MVYGFVGGVGSVGAREQRTATRGRVGVALWSGGRRSPTPSVVPDAGLQQTLKEWGLENMKFDGDFAKVQLIHEDPPVFMIPDFLSEKRCKLLQKHAAGIRAEKSGDAEADLYLNYRVNQEQKSGATSSEAEKLIAEQNISDEKLNAGQTSGFRTKISPAVVRPVLLEMQTFMGIEDRDAEFEEGIWYKPNKRTLFIRDQTVVHYQVGEGVAPHIDGKDATLLCYLNDMPDDDSGGHTVFPEIGLSVPPKQGTALLYNSKTELLHYAEAVSKGEKWIMQLLIDFQFDPSAPTINWKTGEVLQ